MTIQDFANISPDQIQTTFVNAAGDTDETALEIVDILRTSDVETACMERWANALMVAIAEGVASPQQVIITALVTGVNLALKLSETDAPAASTEPVVAIPADLLSFLESHVKAPEEM